MNTGFEHDFKNVLTATYYFSLFCSWIDRRRYIFTLRSVLQRWAYETILDSCEVKSEI